MDTTTNSEKIDFSISGSSWICMAISLNKVADYYYENSKAFTKAYAIERITEIRDALIEIDWKATHVEELISNLSKSDK